MSASAKDASARLEVARSLRHQAYLEYKRLASGRISISDVLRDPARYPGLSSCTIFDVLRRTPKLGRRSARRILEEMKIWPLEKVGGLTRVERNLILLKLPSRVL